MSATSTIEWTDRTWNSLVGCTKVSPGCAGCYACKDVVRMAGNPNPKVASANVGLAYRQKNGILNWTGVVRQLPERLALPFEWPNPGKVFVNSLSDLFHEDVPLAFILRAFAVMSATPWNVYQVLTKRAERLAELSPEIIWPENVWQGVSVESAAYTSRIDRLRRTGAKVKFLSVEPLLGPIPAMDLAGIDWVITGGESGPRARLFGPAWALDIRDQCHRQGVKFFHKQNGCFVVGSKRRVNKKASGRLLDGRTYDEMPAIKAVDVPGKRERMRLAAELVPEADAGKSGRIGLELA